MNIELIEKSGETIFPFLVYGNNRSSKILEYHKKVYSHFGMPMNYFEFGFPNISHGAALNFIINQTIDDMCPDYYLITEIDSIFLREDALDDLFDKVKDHRTISGGLHNSNHLTKADGTTNRPYISPSMHLISRELYDKLGRPTYDHGGDCDCAEAVTAAAQAKGYCIAGIWPREVIRPDYNLGNGLKFGFGTTYGDYYYHQMNAGDSDHESSFIAKCEEVLNK